ncbi:MAG: TonB-dependent receptor [Lewinella sp.]|nr:TonB-dependent receptor [Lewinella sp.]
MPQYTFTLLLCLLGSVLAAQNDTLIYDLPNVTIRENRLETPFAETSRSINVITASQIRQLPVRSVNELLQYVAGVDVRQRGAHGVQADVGIRGGTFDQTLILVNGIKLSDPQTGHHNMNLPFDLENIERIEILKGPGARIYGQNAFAGAINIITKTPEQTQARVALRAGENELLGTTFTLSVPQGDMAHYFSFAKDYSGGYRYNTDYDITSFFYQNTYEQGVHRLQLLAGHAEREFGANGFYASPDFQDQYEEVNTSFVSLAYQTHGDRWTLKPRLSWRKNKDDYIFVRNNPSLYENIHTSNTLTGEVHAAFNSRLGQTGLGVEISRVDLQSTNLGDRQRWVNSLFFEHRFAWWDGRIDLTPGFSLNRYSDFGTRFFPGLDLGVRLSRHVKAFANAGYTYRVPTFTDLYYEDPANNGNPDLQPEEAIAYELGLKYDRPGLLVQASVFQRDGYDLIDWTKPVDTLRWTPVNINELTTRGAELNGQVYFPVLLGHATVLERLQLGYTYLDNDLANNGAAFSRYALENLTHQLIAGVTYRPASRLLHSIYYRYTDRVNLPDYQLVDTRLTYESTKSFSAFVEVSNLFDVTYRETNLVVMPGRWLKAGVSWRWGW